MMWGNNWMNGFMWESPGLWWGIGLFAVLDLVLKGFALWKSSQRKQTWWFIALLIVNSAGILPAIYLFMHKDFTALQKPSKKTSKKR